MSLPIRTTVDDIKAVCGYLAKKPTGASLKEAKSVLDSKHLDGRKLTALKFWKLIEDQEDRLKLTTRGREAVKDGGLQQAGVLTEVIREVEPYNAIVERVAHRNEDSISALDVASHWHDHFREQVSESDQTLNDQAVCFFQLCQGADLGEVIIGRSGAPTRFAFERITLVAFIEGREHQHTSVAPSAPTREVVENPSTRTPPSGSSGIFVAHGRNKKPLEQLKKILEQFKIPYRVAVDEPNLGRPIGAKVKEIMASCNCAILIFTADEEFFDQGEKTVWRPSENVIYELGAASYLYGDRIVILKEEEVHFPANFRDLGYISFVKDQLDAKSLDVLKELIGFGIVKLTT